VASGAERAKMRITLGATRLDRHFGGRVFGADQVAHAKPAPDVYLLAMRETGLDPSRTIVIEDTPTGTRAGVAAGATVLGFCERNDPRGLLEAGAVAVFAAMSELPRLLGVH
jgi:beta-phosphoglucomutase-like phosphatase (HAD superfamily)